LGNGLRQRRGVLACGCTNGTGWVSGRREPHGSLCSKLRYGHRIDWSRAAADATTLRARRGGDTAPADRGRKGTKDHLLTSGNGLPLSTHASAANVNEVPQLRTLLKQGQPVAGKLGRPKRTREAARTAPKIPHIPGCGIQFLEREPDPRPSHFI
jgi:hypothetical protein